MSSLFSINIADTNFDDLEDEDFLIEACSFNFAEPKSDDLATSFGTTGNDNMLAKNKSNSLRGFACTNNSDVSNSPSAFLRATPANTSSKTVYGGWKNGTRQELQALSAEPVQKRPLSSVAEKKDFNNAWQHKKGSNVTLNGRNKECAVNNNLSFDISYNKELHRKKLKSSNKDARVSVEVQHTPNKGRTPTKNVHCRSFDGLRYTQTTQIHARPSPTLNKDIQRGDTLSTKSTKTSNTSSVLRNDCSPIAKDLSVANNYNQRILYPANNVRHSCELEIQQSPGQVNKSFTNEKYFTPKKRRFPGPAGMLPRLEPGENLNNLPNPFAETPKKKSPEICQIINNVDSDEDFSTDPWRTMQEQIIKHNHTPLESLALVIQKATSQQLDNGKAAFLGVLVKSLSPSGLDASVVLKDPSGEMRGTLHRKVLEEHQLEPGYGLFLKLVSVFSPSPRKHYLNITPGNIVEIFPVSNRELTSSEMVSQETPRRQLNQVIREADMMTEQQTGKNNNLCEGNFDDLLKDLNYDDDILVEAMCL